MPYEFHNFKDDELKIVCRLDRSHQNKMYWLHWHENPELLYFVEGSSRIYLDGEWEIFSAGDLAVIAPNRMHNIETLSPVCADYLLICDLEFMGSIDRLPHRTRDPQIISLYEAVIKEMTEKPIHYREAVAGYLRCIFALLSRQAEGKDLLDDRDDRKTKLVKQSIQYMYENFSSAISLENISGAMGVSKHYLCHVFKELTGKTVLEHLNHIRCDHAKSMLRSGMHNVSQSAQASGFASLAYFSQTYKKIMGRSPGEDKK